MTLFIKSYQRRCFEYAPFRLLLFSNRAQAVKYLAEKISTQIIVDDV